MNHLQESKLSVTILTPRLNQRVPEPSGYWFLANVKVLATLAFEVVVK